MKSLIYRGNRQTKYPISRMSASMSDNDITQTLDSLIRETSGSEKPTLIFSSKNITNGGNDNTNNNKTIPIHDHNLTPIKTGFSSYKTRTRNGSKSQGSRRENGNNDIDDFNYDKFKTAYNVKTSILKSIDLNNDNNLINLLDKFNSIRLDNSKLKNDIWQSVSNLSLNELENKNVPVFEENNQESDDENENDDDDDDSDWDTPTYHYKPNINSLLFHKAKSNQELKKILLDYKKYNSNLQVIIEDYKKSFDSIIDELLRSYMIQSDEFAKSVESSNSSMNEIKDKIYKSWLKSSVNLSSVGSLGTKILNNVNDL